MVTSRHAFRTLGVFALLLVCLAPLARADDAASGITGAWKWTQAGRGGGAGVEMTLTLKQDGEKVTGTLARAGGTAAPTEIKDGTIKDKDLTFKITRAGRNGGADVTTTYTAKLDGDTLKGQSVADSGNNTNPRPFEAKRGTAASQPATQPATQP